MTGADRRARSPEQAEFHRSELEDTRQRAERTKSLLPAEPLP